MKGERAGRRPRVFANLKPLDEPAPANPVGLDMVNHPPHYRSDTGIECIDAIRAQLGREQFIGYLRGCIAKYNWRLQVKGDAAENARKLGWYNQRLIEELEREVVPST